MSCAPPSSVQPQQIESSLRSLRLDRAAPGPLGNQVKSPRSPARQPSQSILLTPRRLRDNMSRDNGAAAVSAKPEPVIFVSPARTVLSGLHLKPPDGAPARRIKPLSSGDTNQRPQIIVFTKGFLIKVPLALVNQMCGPLERRRELAAS